MAKNAIALKAELLAKADALPPAKGAYVLDEAGLYVQLSPLVAADKQGHATPIRGRYASFIFRYTSPTTGKAREMGLGPWWDVDLAVARQKAKEARELVRQLVDPIDKREADKAALRLAAAKALTFDDAAAKYIALQRPGWANAKHADQWANTLATYASPIFGKLPVADVDLALVVKALQPIWHDKTETATRVRGRIEAVLDWATVSGFRTGDNPARWRGHLDKILPKPGAVAKVEHHAAVPLAGMYDFMQRLAAVEGMGARALEFAVLTAARSGEVRGAKWDEIDLKSRVWVVPAERMKAKREHRVPLSARAVKLLKALPRSDDTDVVFPNSKGLPLSDMTLSAVMRRMGVDATPHGFRSTFRDWAAERTTYPHEMAEMALAHVISSKVEAAYRRGDMFEKRLEMMSDWARFLATKSKGGAR